MPRSVCINRVSSVDRDRRTAVLGALGVSAVVCLAAAALAGCSQSAQSKPGLTGTAAAAQPGLPSVADTLRADPRFSDFVRVIDFAGLGQDLDSARDVTVFAPTNAAFDKTDPGWGMRDTTDGVDSFDTVRARQNRIEQSAVTGIHPPAEFIGKMQDVRTISGRVFRVNGLVPGAITVTASAAGGTGIGFPLQAAQTVRVELPPIRAADGLIYRIDAIMR